MRAKTQLIDKRSIADSQFHNKCVYNISIKDEDHSGIEQRNCGDIQIKWIPYAIVRITNKNLQKSFILIAFFGAHL